MTLLILRWIGVALWVGVVAYLAKPSLRAFRHKVRPMDPLWAVIWMLALNRLFYQGTGVFIANAPASDTEMAWRIFLQLWTIAIAVGIIALKYWNKAPRDE